MHLVLTWIYEMVSHPGILDAVEDVLGPNILCWNATFFTKEANDPGHVTWHQDATYWGMDSQDICSAWIALSPSTVESGAMQVMPGTHHSEILEHEDTFDKHNLLTVTKESKDPDESKAVNQCFSRVSFLFITLRLSMVRSLTEQMTGASASPFAM